MVVKNTIADPAAKYPLFGRYSRIRFTDTGPRIFSSAWRSGA